MAKGKSTRSGKLKSASSSKPRSSASSDGRPPASKKSATKGQGEVSAMEIGHVAGEIWALLSSDGEHTLASIKKSVKAPSDVVLAAIGWLAREDKLEFASSGRAVKISLR